MHVIPPNGFPNVPSFADLDAIAKQIENIPTFTSNDRAFLEELPAFPSEDGTKVLKATTTSGETSLSYGDIENELPETPTEDGTKVLTATTVSGETVLSWENPSTVNYSTTEQLTGQKWIDGKDIYSKTVNLGTLPNDTVKTVSADISPNTVVKIEAFCVDANSTLPIPRTASGNNSIDIYYTYSTNSIVVTTEKDMSTHTGYVTLYYTKQTT